MQMCVFKLKLTEKYRQMRDYEEGKTCQDGWVKFQGNHLCHFYFCPFPNRLFLKERDCFSTTQKEITGQTDYYLVVLSSKTYVLKTN